MVFHIQNLEDLRKAIKSSIDDAITLPPEIARQSMYSKSVSAFLNKTGLISEALNVLEDELLCAVCLEIPLQPCLTKCHHVFCVSCLQMWLTPNKRQCPKCRTFLATEQTPLFETNSIIYAVMLKHNPQYVSWSNQEKLERFCRYMTQCLQRLHHTIAKCLGVLRFFHDDEKLIEEVNDLSQSCLSLLEELPRSRADVEGFLKKKEQLYQLTKLKLNSVALFEELFSDRTRV